MIELPNSEVSSDDDENDTIQQKRYEVLSPVKPDFYPELASPRYSNKLSNYPPLQPSNGDEQTHKRAVDSVDDALSDDEILRPELDSLDIETPAHLATSVTAQSPASVSPQFTHNHELRMRSLYQSSRRNRDDLRDFRARLALSNEDTGTQDTQDQDQDQDQYDQEENHVDSDREQPNAKPGLSHVDRFASMNKDTSNLSEDVVEIEPQEFHPNPNIYGLAPPQPLSTKPKPLSPLKPSLASPFKLSASSNIDRHVGFGDGSQEMVEVRHFSPDISTDMSEGSGLAAVPGSGSDASDSYNNDEPYEEKETQAEARRSQAFFRNGSESESEFAPKPRVNKLPTAALKPFRQTRHRTSPLAKDKLSSWTVQDWNKLLTKLRDNYSHRQDDVPIVDIVKDLKKHFPGCTTSSLQARILALNKRGF